ncbi:response regulator [Neptunitalea lumnitzerae]|uniref:Response regulatory domain-containing protein n=1 Tax=Neptunitalea lumnitzerae TaxID=2965509 RepID=A0ABQ5MKE9_9FLAO|nr:response regulator [Neptunitalea sp. Y10]GLB49888.1 hypothetical protein Y10_22560 [Neptunitalea sp. Y10]
MNPTIPKTVFLVDDQKISNFINRRLFTNCNFSGDIYCFEDPADALSALEEILPDMILLDLNMPKINGWDFLEILSNNKKFNTIRIVVATSSTSPIDKNSAKRFPQVKDYLIKPLNGSMINKLLHNAGSN